MAKQPGSLAAARSFVKKLLPDAFGRKRRDIGVWDVFAKPGASSPLDMGFSLEQAWIDASVRLGKPKPRRQVWGGIPLP